MSRKLDFHDESALLDRLSVALRRRPQEVIFLVGAPLSAPTEPGSPGVPDVAGMIELIRNEFADDSVARSALDQKLSKAGKRFYETAFSFLQGWRGQPTANEIVCRAVLASRVDAAQIFPINFADLSAAERTCRTLEADISGWHLNAGTKALGALVSNFGEAFGKSVLTTNFDPLIEIAIQRASGRFYKTVLHSDGNLGQTEAAGTHVVHLHGSWLGTDTLHTARQLSQPQPQLKDSLRSLLRNRLVVACGYGGWDDVFMDALMAVVNDVNALPEVLWASHNPHRLDDDLADRLGPGIDRARINLYGGIDCNVFLPRLYEIWQSEHPIDAPAASSQSNPVLPSQAISQKIHSQDKEQIIIEGNDEDNPPAVEIIVGRDKELRRIGESTAKIVFLTGMGGQGKSTIAATYYSSCQSERRYSFYVWRDCKEESQRFENQLSSVIETLTAGKVSGEDLARQNSAAIVEILVPLLADRKVLFVFDNVDHYVNLEARRMTGAANEFIASLLQTTSQCQVVFTCRPGLSYAGVDVLNIPLEGISLDAALKLFLQRGARSDSSEIKDAHRLTNGHAFWLDLLAIQAGKQQSPVDLATLVAQIGTSSELEERTLILCLRSDELQQNVSRSSKLANS